MAPSNLVPGDKRAFYCGHCSGQVLVPWNLPVTTAPCPHCGAVITSPAPDSPAQPGPAVPAIPIPEVSISASVSPYAEAPVTAVPSPETTAIPPQREIPPAPTSENPAETSQPAETQPVSLPPAEPKKTAIIPVLILLALLLGAAGGALYIAAKSLRKQSDTSGKPASSASRTHGKIAEDSYIRSGWQKEALQVLDGFLKAKTVREKLPFVLNGKALESQMESFYGGVEIKDLDTPVEAFSAFDLSEEDRRRGLFVMVYDQPPQLDMKEFFSPLAPVEVQKGLAEPDLLLSVMAKVGNFAMEPVRVQAFFKRVDGELKLDWEIFAQTKYRRLQNFAELPEAGLTGVFRVLIFEDVPSGSQHEPGTRTYRVVDAANQNDGARINVKVDSELGRTLSILNWRGMEGGQPAPRTATVELRWGGEADRPVLEINRFICWEFLGLGGKESPEPAPLSDGTKSR